MSSIGQGPRVKEAARRVITFLGNNPTTSVITPIAVGALLTAGLLVLFGPRQGWRWVGLAMVVLYAGLSATAGLLTTLTLRNTVPEHYGGYRIVMVVGGPMGAIVGSLVTTSFLLSLLGP